MGREGFLCSVSNFLVFSVRMLVGPWKKCNFAVEKKSQTMNGVSLQVNLPDYGNYEPAELTRILTRIAMRLIGKDTQKNAEEETLCVYTVEEVKALTLQRGRDIKAGRVKLIPHDEVMDEMEQLLASYAD